MIQPTSWNKTVADAKKILGNNVKIPEASMHKTIQISVESDKVWATLTALREALKKKILEQKNADSRVTNSLRQAYDEVYESDFGLDEKKPEDKKKLDAAQAVFDKFFKQVEGVWKQNADDLDQLDMHLMNLAKYKRA
jgi:hypothetical protein